MTGAWGWAVGPRLRSGVVAVRPLICAAIAATGVVVAVRLREPNPRQRAVQFALDAVIVLATVGVAAIAARWNRTRLVADIVVAVASTLGVFAVATALSGTPYLPFDGDVTFRMAAATRFTHTWHFIDYGYRGLPAGYPPLFPWAAGRIGALVGTPGWEVLKYVSLAFLAVMPVATYALWRRLVPTLAAALIGASAVLGFVAYQAEEWLAAAVFVPWAILVLQTDTGGLRRPRIIALGVIGAVLIPLYYFYYLPFALVVVAGVLIGRRWGPRVHVRALARILGIAVVLSAWYWLPLAVSYAAASHFDSGQTRYLHPGPSDFIFPAFGPNALGILDWLGLGYLATRFKADRVARGLVAVLTGAYAFLGIGRLTTHFAHDTLVYWRVQHIIVLALLAAGVLGGAAVVSWLHRTRSTVPTAYVALGAAALSAFAAIGYADQVRTSGQVRRAHLFPLPDGGEPKYGAVPVTHRAVVLSHDRTINGSSEPRVRALALANNSPQPSDARLWHTLTSSPDLGDPEHAVIVCARTSLEWFYPIFYFNQHTPSYAHAAGGYRARQAFLDRLSRTGDAATFAHLAGDNAFDTIDAFVLFRYRGHLIYVDRVDKFGNGTRPHLIAFRNSQFSSTYWSRRDVGPYLVAIRLPN